MHFTSSHWNDRCALEAKLSPDLQMIYTLELTLGNVVVRVNDSGQTALPLPIIFKEPLHRAEIEAKIKISPSVTWYAIGNFAGYVSVNTRQSLQGPAPAIATVAQGIRERISTSLCSIYDLELFLGNTVIGVDEPAGSRCPLAVNFQSPIHKNEIESRLALPPTVKWWEYRDPHYSIEGGYACDSTGHALIGPLPGVRR